MTNREMLAMKSNRDIEIYFGQNTICEYIQDNFKEHCDSRHCCVDCIEEWLESEYEESGE